MRSIVRRLYLNMKTQIDTISVSGSAYEELQNRSGALEFVDPRVKIMSTLVYIVPQFQKRLRETAPSIDSYKILDAGARDGWTVSLLNQLGFEQVLGVELVGQLVDHAQKRGRNVVKGDIQALDLPDNEFHLVLCRHTLEHTTNPRLAIQELVRVCAPDGMILITLPIERNARGKHTTAIPNIRLLKGLVRGLPVSILKAGRSASTGVIQPDGDEGLLLLQK